MIHAHIINMSNLLPFVSASACFNWLLFMQVGFETEGTAIYDTMQFVKNEVSNHFPCKALQQKGRTAGH